MSGPLRKIAGPGGQKSIGVKGLNLHSGSACRFFDVSHSGLDVPQLKIKQKQKEIECKFQI